MEVKLYGEEEYDNSMLRLLAILYSRGVFREFRRPVLAVYPNLCENYLDIVKEPMDLGTLLLEVENGRHNIESFRRALHLITSNALLFNSGYATIEAMSKHFEFIAEAFFEEILKVPYIGDMNNFNHETFENSVRKRRFGYYRLIRDLPLNHNEIENLLTILDHFPHEKLPGYKHLVNKVKEHINDHKETPLTLREALSPIKQTCYGSAISENEESYNLWENEKDEVVFGEALFGHKEQVEHDDFLRSMDQLLVFLPYLLVERYFRGDSFSTSWAQPYPLLLWYPLEKDSKKRIVWWPCLVVAAQRPDVNMENEIIRRNLERIPFYIAKQLLRGRPKGIGEDVIGEDSVLMPPPSSSTAIGTLSPNHVAIINALLNIVKVGEVILVEYLGDHTFGWARPVYRLFSDPPPAPARLCTQQVMAEAEEAATWLTQRKESCGEAADEEGSDLLRLPSLEEMRQTVETSAAQALYAKLQQRKRRAVEEEAEESRHQSKRTRSAASHLLSSADGDGYQGLEELEEDDDDIHDGYESKIDVGKLSSDSYRVVANSKCLEGERFSASRVPLPVTIRRGPEGERLPNIRAINHRRRALARTWAFSSYLQRVKTLSLRDSRGSGQAQYSVNHGRKNGTSTLRKQGGDGEGEEEEDDDDDEGGEGEDNDNDVGSSSHKSPSVPVSQGTPNKLKNGKPILISSVSAHADAPDIYLEDPKQGATLSSRGGKPLEIGCSRYLAGEGLVYTRKVDLSSALFFRESVHAARRKELLNLELRRIEASITALGHSPSLPTEPVVANNRPKTTTVNVPGKIGLLAKGSALNQQMNTNTNRNNNANTNNRKTSGGRSNGRSSLPLGVSDMLPF
eukprot:gene7967-8788_t